MEYKNVKVGMKVSTSDTGRVGVVLSCSPRKIVLKMAKSALTLTKADGVSLEEFYSEIEEFNYDQEFSNLQDCINKLTSEYGTPGNSQKRDIQVAFNELKDKVLL